MKYKIEYDEEICIGCGACTICDNWELTEEGKSKPLITELEEIGCNQEAIDVCPVQAIKIKKIK